MLWTLRTQRLAVSVSIVVAAACIALLGPQLLALESHKDVVSQLREGNARFAAQQASYPNVSAERRAETAKGQHPFATVIACSDSRVPVELLFDRGIGDLFVVRVAREGHPDLKGDKLIAETVRTNVWQSIEDLLTKSQILREAVKSGHAQVVGAVYDLESGRVEWIGSHPDQSKFLAE
jgi:carbonic anhydrase